jgi:hypothetical protein
MPTSKMGRWILEEEDKMSVDHINYIRNLYKETKRYEGMPEQTEYVIRHAKELRDDLNLARRYQKPIVPQKGKKKEYTVFYAEYDVFDNYEVLGEDFIWQMYRDSPPLIWRTAFMNERLFKVANGFYSALDDNIHFYLPPDNGRLSVLGSDWKKLTMSGCMGDGDVDFTKPIHIAFDSNAAISSCAIGQVICNELRTIHSFFVKTPRKLQDLCQVVCDYYLPKINKDVVFYYDHTFVWTSGNNPESYSETVMKVFNANRYKITGVYIGQAPRHDWKHLQIDLALKGDPSLLFPTFNLIHNEYLKIAMEQSGIRQGKNGFEKDKTPEGTPDTPDTPDEYKTHITDAWDTLFTGMNFYFVEPSKSSGGAIFL